VVVGNDEETEREWDRERERNGMEWRKKNGE
jgi:hypothetical protein